LIHHTVLAVLIAVATELAARVRVPVPAVPSPRFRVSDVIAIERTPAPTLIKEITEPTGMEIVPSAGRVYVCALPDVCTIVFPASARTIP
jgi:hypothetical protein